MTDHSDLIAELGALSAYPGDAYDRAAAALSSQSLSLSEAREEIERLRGERDEALQLAYDLKYAAAGGEDAPGSAHAVTVDDVDRWRREAWDVAATDRCRVAEAIEALRPFAAFAKYWDDLQTPDDRKFIIIGDACKLTVGDLRRARKALENGPAGLADAHTNPSESDLSSLRKGAETLWQPIETAPTDYTHVIGMDAEGNVVRTWLFAPPSITRNWLKVPGGGKWKPVQWMPLPAALVSGSREEQS